MICCPRLLASSSSDNENFLLPRSVRLLQRLSASAAVLFVIILLSVLLRCLCLTSCSLRGTRNDLSALGSAMLALNIWMDRYIMRADSFSSGQNIPCLLWNPKVNLNFHKRPVTIPLQSTWRFVLILYSHPKWGCAFGLHKGVCWNKGVEPVSDVRFKVHYEELYVLG